MAIIKNTCIIFAIATVSASAHAYEGVNAQVTDAITQTNVKVVAESPAQAMGMDYMQTNRMQAMMVTNCRPGPNLCACLKDYARKQAVVSLYPEAIRTVIQNNGCPKNP